MEALDQETVRKNLHPEFQVSSSGNITFPLDDGEEVKGRGHLGAYGIVIPNSGFHQH